MLRKRMARHEESQLNSLVLILILIILTFVSSRSQIDYIYTPKLLSLLVVLLIFLLINIRSLIKACNESLILKMAVLILLIPFFLNFLKIDLYIGEAFRANGISNFPLFAACMLLGAQIRTRSEIRLFQFILTIFGLLVSLIIIIGVLIEIDATSIVAPLSNSNQSGGINENFRSIFIAICLLMHRSPFDIKSYRIRTLNWMSILIHLYALLILDSQQSFLLLALAFIFYIFLKRNELQKYILLIPLFVFIVYVLALNKFGFTKFGSSIQERILIARKTIQYLANPEYLAANPFGVSELDFKGLWVDNVHNVYLQLGLTAGFLFTIAYTAFICLIFLRLPKIGIVEEVRQAVCIIAALQCVFIVTMLDLIFSPIYFVLWGMVLGRLNFAQIPKMVGHKVAAQLMKKLSSFTVIVLTAGLIISTVVVIKQASLDGKIFQEVRELKLFSGSELKAQQYSVIGKLKESSNVYLIYEVGRRAHEANDCQSLDSISKILVQKSQNHFLSGKLLALSKACEVEVSP
jgi:hypothetical protein